MTEKNGYWNIEIALTSMKIYVEQESENISRDHEKINRAYKRARDAAMALGMNVIGFPRRITQKRIKRNMKLNEIRDGYF